MAKPIPRAGVMDIPLYTPGRTKPRAPGAGPIHKLSSNESALGSSARAKEAFMQASDAIARYPEDRAGALREAIGRVHDLDRDQLIIGAGSDEIIQMMLSAYCAPGDEVLQTEHAFSYYTVAAQAAGAVPVLAPEISLTADLSALLERVTPRTRIVFLANPNNPTGTMVSRADLVTFREQLRADIVLVLDGAYAEYVTSEEYTDGRDLVDASIRTGDDNVLMMRTFSKIYGLGGLRVGWAYGPTSLIETLERVRTPFNVNAAALAAAQAAVEDQAFVTRNREHNFVERARVEQALASSGFDIVRGHGNFVLFAARGDDHTSRAADAVHILSVLEGRGVMVRSASSSHLPGYIRVSIGPTASNDAFLLAMKSV